MGRYYHGDIEGKFMFAVQSSIAADRFGSEHTTPGEVNYYFDEDQVPTLDKELAKLKSAFDKVSKFFENKETYTSKQVEEANITEEELSDFADYRLGKQILDFVVEHGSCSFTAEL